MPAVDSSAILAIDYAPAASRLEIVFVSGIRYAYEGVPAALYEAMLAAPSKGEFFNRNIRDAYPFARCD